MITDTELGRARSIDAVRQDLVDAITEVSEALDLGSCSDARERYGVAYGLLQQYAALAQRAHRTDVPDLARSVHDLAYVVKRCRQSSSLDGAGNIGGNRVPLLIGGVLLAAVGGAYMLFRKR
jgi:hypothetical protein